MASKYVTVRSDITGKLRMWNNSGTLFVFGTEVFLDLNYVERAMILDIRDYCLRKTPYRLFLICASSMMRMLGLDGMVPYSHSGDCAIDSEGARLITDSLPESIDPVLVDMLNLIWKNNRQAFDFYFSKSNRSGFINIRPFIAFDNCQKLYCPCRILTLSDVDAFSKKNKLDEKYFLIDNVLRYLMVSLSSSEFRTVEQFTDGVKFSPTFNIESVFYKAGLWRKYIFKSLYDPGLYLKFFRVLRAKSDYHYKYPEMYSDLKGSLNDFGENLYNYDFPDDDEVYKNALLLANMFHQTGVYNEIIKDVVKHNFGYLEYNQYLNLL